MNAEANEAMERMARQINSLPEKAQNRFFKDVEKTVGKKEARTLMMLSTLYKMLTDKSFYKAVERTLAEATYKKFTTSEEG